MQFSRVKFVKTVKTILCVKGLEAMKKTFSRVKFVKPVQTTFTSKIRESGESHGHA